MWAGGMNDKLGRKLARFSGSEAVYPTKWLVSRKVVPLTDNDLDDGTNCILSKVVAHAKFVEALNMLKSILRDHDRQASNVVGGWSTGGVRKASGPGFSQPVEKKT